jgi:hypothetical protein
MELLTSHSARKNFRFSVNINVCHVRNAIKIAILLLRVVTADYFDRMFDLMV